jgi:hypothetical protein
MLYVLYDYRVLRLIDLVQNAPLSAQARTVEAE